MTIYFVEKVRPGSPSHALLRIRPSVVDPRSALADARCGLRQLLCPPWDSVSPCSTRGLKVDGRCTSPTHISPQARTESWGRGSSQAKSWTCLRVWRSPGGAEDTASQEGAPARAPGAAGQPAACAGPFAGQGSEPQCLAQNSEGSKYLLGGRRWRSPGPV